MYERFLNNNDYTGLITKEALSQITRDNAENFLNAEEAAEISLVEYLSNNYEIEKELEIGKRIKPYNRRITYPVGSHFLYTINDELVVCEALRTINGSKAPIASPYWMEYTGEDTEEIEPYSQIKTYFVGDKVKFANTYYICVRPNGFGFNDIRVPGAEGWIEVECYEWLANVNYSLWHPVKWEGKYYALINLENIDTTVNPNESDNWGLVGEYDPDYNGYEFSETEYVEFEGRLFVPAMDVNSDELKVGYNLRRHDPRNANVKKHMLRLAVYELTKMISPNNVSTARITDYEASIAWLRDASRLSINPQIPRKIDEDKKPVTDYAIATFMRDYNPNDNDWQI